MVLSGAWGQVHFLRNGQKRGQVNFLFAGHTNEAGFVVSDLWGPIGLPPQPLGNDQANLTACL